MSQATAAIANMSRTLFRAAVNAIAQALQSQNSGATAPSETYAYMPWADTTTGWLKQRNAANSGWIFVRPLAGHAEASVASAGTTDLGASTSDLVLITGTTTITSFGTADAGRVVKVRHSGVLTLTHNATSLILPGGASITTAAGDTYEAESLGSGNWVVRAYQKASGAPVVSTGLTSGTKQNASGSSIDFTGIPAGTKRITVNFSALSSNGTAITYLQIGDSGGLETSGYLSVVETASSRYTSTTGFGLIGVGTATWSMNGRVVLELLDSATNTWIAEIMCADSAGGAVYAGAGSKALSATLDRLSLVTTDTWDAGMVNITYQ